MIRKVTEWFIAEPRNVFDVLKYTEMMCSIVGISTHHYVGDPANGQAKRSVPKVVNFVVMNMLLMAVAIVFASIPYDQLNNGIIIVTYGIRTLLVGCVFGISGTTIVQAWQWKSIVHILKRVHQLDLEFQLMKHPIDFALHKKRILVGYAGSMVVLIVLLLASSINTLEFIDDRSVSLPIVFARIYFSIVYYTMLGLYLSMAYVISQHFVHLNHALEMRFDTSNDRRGKAALEVIKYRAMSTPEQSLMVQKLANMYHQLNEIVDLVNSQFGDVIVLNVIVTLQTSAFNVFICLKMFAKHDLRYQMYSSLNFASSVFYTVLFMVMVQISRVISKQSKFTGTLLHRAMNNVADEQLIRSMMLFSRQVRYRSADISSKQVVVGWPFVFETLVVLASYLVILLQFDASMRSKQ